MSNVVGIGVRSKKSAIAAQCTTMALRLEEVPGLWHMVGTERRIAEPDLDVVAGAYRRIRELSDEALLELRDEYERRLGTRTRYVSKFFSSEALVSDAFSQAG